MLRIARFQISSMAVVIIFLEAGLLYFFSYAYYQILASKGLSFNLAYDSVATLIAFGSIVGMTSVGMYDRKCLFHIDVTISRALVVLPLVLFVLAIFFIIFDYAVQGRMLIGNHVLCFASIITFLPALVVLRIVCLYILDHFDGFKQRSLVIGAGLRASGIQKLSQDLRHRSFVIVGYVKLEPNNIQPNTEGSTQSTRRRNSGDQQTEDMIPCSVIDPNCLLKFCIDNCVNEIIVAYTERRGMPVNDLLECKINGINTIDFGAFWERETGQIFLDDMSPSWLLFSEEFQLGKGRVIVQRTFDIVVSCLLLLLTLPITLLTALLIKLESEGPIFYCQERVGLRGKPFNVIKFRSMRTDAEKYGPRWASKNDNRVTRVGSIIRKVRIDEIPQVFNVLKGDMAFVGPRPERPVFVSFLAEKIPYYNVRHAAKPGITGWAQINYPYGATEEDAKRKLAYDLYYIRNGGFILDVLIMMQTVKVILWHDGAH
ncbi:MAG: TIGR03013 family XrtA/PEP-CTERM system glycosyltransferase [Verrucomicrobiota bacterium]